MELTYTVKQLHFADTGHFAYPHATVLVQLEPCPVNAVPAIRLVIRITTADACAGLHRIADAALTAARTLLPAAAARAHLEALLAEELALQQARRARDDLALRALLPSTRPPSGG